MADEQNEMKTFNVPRSHGKWYYPGVISVLMGVISILISLLYNAERERRACQNELREEQKNSRDYLKDWANKAFDERYEEKKKEMDPKVDELKAVIDSLKKKRKYENENIHMRHIDLQLYQRRCCAVSTG